MFLNLFKLIAAESDSLILKKYNVHYAGIMSKELFGHEPVKKKLKLNYNNNHYTSSSTMPSDTSITSEQNNVTFKPLADIENQNCNKIKHEVKYLEVPIKSANDKKQYRVIQLQNGLTALLIADTAQHHDVDNQNMNEDKSCNDVAPASSSSEDETDNENGEESDESEDNDERDSQDINDDMYASDEANNKREKHKLSSKREEKMAACGLCIGVGSFSDPPEIPGLAHFLEHMVFMGSEKYPKENDFDSFIQKCGGSDNAYTDPEQTTFYFEIVEKHLLQGLDKFAQFFVAPLMLRDAITREREAVESEFQMAQPSDSNRKEQLFSSLAQPKHPATKFQWGNLITLRDNISEDKLYEKLHEFRKRHYSAHRMTLSIQAKLPLNTLEEYVVNCFSAIPNNNLPAEDFNDYIGAKSFDTINFRRIYKIKPIKDVCQVELTWTMPPLHNLYRIKPHQYISWIIGHEGKGSLISYLRKKMWCLDIMCGNSESGFEHSSMYALFSLTLTLTNEGHEHLKEILDTLFSYINMLHKFGPQKRLYDEIRAIEDINFKFIDDVPAIDYVQDLSDNMRLFAPTDYITGSSLYYDYNPEVIKNCLDILRPDNVNIIISNKQYDETTFDKTEMWFDTKYTDEEIPKDWVDCWKDIKPFNEFNLPEPNIYLPDDFTLIPLEKVCEYPIKIHQDNLYELWYKPDAKFRLPECYMNFHLISSSVTSSPEGAAMAELMVMMLKQLLAEELYPASAAEFKYEVQASRKGLMIELSGFNQKLPLLLETIITYMSKYAELVTENLFRVLKSELLKAYYNESLKPDKFEKEVRLSILMLTSWTSIEKYNAIKNISFSEYKHFITYFKKHVYIQGLVQGNMTEEEVLNNVLKIFKHLNCGVLLPNTMPHLRVMSLPVGNFCCRFKNFNPTDTNSLVSNYYQSNLRCISLTAIIELFIMIIEEPLFNELRTQQQLGYDVSCLYHDTFGVLGYSVTVVTQADKFTTEEIDDRINKFLMNFQTKLDEMSEKEFEDVKKSLIQLKQCADIHLREEVFRNWAEITSREYVFDRLNIEINEINVITLQQIRDWFKTHIIDADKRKKLSLQIVGCSDKKNAEHKKKVLNCNEENGLTIEHLSDLSNNDNTSKLHYNECIVDIARFKNKLFIYPLHSTKIDV